MNAEAYKKRVLECVKDDIIQDVDGYYYFWPTANRGHHNSVGLRIIADHLDEINNPWDADIRQFFEKEQADDRQQSES